jgi:hypothetical protein
MSEKVKVRIQTSCKVYYDQTVEMTREEWEKLKLTTERKMCSNSLSPLVDLIYLRDVTMQTNFDEPELTVVDDDGKLIKPIDCYDPED